MVGNWRQPLLLALLGTLAACGGNEAVPAGDNLAATSNAAAAAKPPLALSAAEFARIGVTFAPVESVSELPVATVPATLAPPPNARVAVAAVIPGVVTRTMVVEGDSVRAGQPLATVAAREMFTLAAGIDQAAARVAVARANDRRLGQLAREGVIAGSRADEARAALREAEAELNEQRRIVRLVNGSPNRGSYTLTAPIAGKITSATITTGSPVSEATSAYVIDAQGRYELTAQLPERLLGQVRPGMKVRVPASSGEDVRGEVTSVGTVIDPQTRSATLRARLPASAGVVSGRAVSATLYAPAADGGAIAVPAAAVTDVDGKPSVFVRTPQGAAVRTVATGDRADGRIVIRSGLRAGEQIAVAGVSELKSIAGQN
ncbi:efflux RND transporter periplasmic adaptor subunit [Sphingomonas sp. IC4-52]|uniref:efflux RND transporter periplasmic adaptor subunit n=1 Tax=Sphingomonas sp. IC4-52 TaxID=2887202 RepID=UPI001D108DB1|nr:efflux RND transporter periplasmic adaptor subunit [Sphingomonas sp. IC4-52]MCC2981206.1 efflux RND transporter periplasmic adaptor subunit [Sphingomonas sp. IC4-52]